MNWLSKWRKHRRLRKLIGNRSFLNLGSVESPWPGFVTCGLSEGLVEIFHDATQPYPVAMQGRFDFIWSERMLEHIRCDELPALFAALKTLMRPMGRARFCLPLCFYGTPSINMVRVGNAERCREYGHVTWFTHEGVGAVSDEVFGCKSPPNLWKTWEALLLPAALAYVPVRHYDVCGELFVDRALMRDDSPNPSPIDPKS